MNKKITLIGFFLIALAVTGIATLSSVLDSVQDIKDAGLMETISAEEKTNTVYVTVGFLVEDTNGNFTDYNKTIDCDKYLTEAEQDTEIARIVQIARDGEHFEAGTQVAVKVLEITGTNYIGQEDKYLNSTTKELEALKAVPKEVG